MSIILELESFKKTNRFNGKGAISLALVITDRARAGLPIDPEKLLTKGLGQVKGLGKGAVQTILARHKIARVLAEEAGRTSRDNIRKMRLYVSFLNTLPRPVNVEAIERFWIDQVLAFFAAKPFKFRVDAAYSIRSAVRNLLGQAKERQSDLPGSRYEGTMLQHLVGAKLDLVLGKGHVSHHGASEADQADDRAGDFVFGDVAIHTTTHPGEALVRKCAANLDAGLRPLIVTTTSQTPVADGLAEAQGINDRIDVLDVEQFLAANLHERALFRSENRGPKTLELINRYNELVTAFETDPSLRIEIAGR